MLQRHCMSYLERFIHRPLEVAAAEKKLLHELQPSFNLPAKQEQARRIKIATYKILKTIFFSKNFQAM